MTKMTYAEAARLALKEEMERDSTVWALGEDLGFEGGMGGQYKDLQAEFGADRIVDTPISEATIMGAAIGAALAGTRPIAELRFSDFAMCAVDELVNQAAKARYMFGGQARVPMIARMPIGIRGGIAAQHSQSPEAWYTHVPGLVVVTPATPADNRGLLKAAIRCDDPVVYMEHKGLWGAEGEVEENDSDPIPLGIAFIWLSRFYSKNNNFIFTQSLNNSVKKTGRLMIVHEAVKVGGFGGEISSEVSEHLINILKAPVKRMGGARIPIPFSIPLEAEYMISEEQIINKSKSFFS